jgi:hypothetical protein
MSHNHQDGYYNIYDGYSPCEETVNSCEDTNDTIPNPCPVPPTRRGSITVFSKLGTQDGEPLEGVKVNLYRLGDCPKLVQCEVTDCQGKVVFNNLEEGSYRVIQIIDRNYFQKPCYIPWNEVNIDGNTRNSTITVVNRLNPSVINRHRCNCNNNCDDGLGWLALILLFGFCGFGFFW